MSPISIPISVQIVTQRLRLLPGTSCVRAMGVGQSPCDRHMYQNINMQKVICLVWCGQPEHSRTLSRKNMAAYKSWVTMDSYHKLSFIPTCCLSLPAICVYTSTGKYTCMQHNTTNINLHTPSLRSIYRQHHKQNLKLRLYSPSRIPPSRNCNLGTVAKKKSWKRLKS